ncbi:HalOD1 output domain-containing protein [Halorarum salinum]|uniref:Halobacterial output domain-containing protein n=1 Tax=Halorarum salinum TaxID=2743089 RepID=A0A7D5QB44_9EURY|nr:HalOD1 output domain-containing protein [Halobaculum salinum]QLG60741.1 hypothetical protein HUG12_02860 [Halobaculum salinum]
MESVRVSTEIVERIATREGVDPVDLDVPLYEAIDTDALEALTNGPGDRHPRAHLRVRFAFYGYAVTVDGSGSVFIDEQPPGAETDESSREEPVDT